MTLRTEAPLMLTAAGEEPEFESVAPVVVHCGVSASFRPTTHPPQLLPHA